MTQMAISATPAQNGPKCPQNGPTSPKMANWPAISVASAVETDFAALCGNPVRFVAAASHTYMQNNHPWCMTLTSIVLHCTAGGAQSASPPVLPPPPSSSLFSKYSSRSYRHRHEKQCLNWETEQETCEATSGAVSVVCQVHQRLVGDRVGTANWCRGALGCEEGDE